MASQPHEPPSDKPLDRQFHATCFSGIAFAGWSDEFRFSVPSAADDLIESIANFYSQRSARLTQRTPQLEFDRGSWFWSIFNMGPESWPF